MIVLIETLKALFFIVGVWATLVNFYQSQGDISGLPMGNVIVQAICIVGFALLKGWVV